MNTSKQINVMIGLLLVIFIGLGAYLINESHRQEKETADITERNAERGARVFVANCRGCHGLDGQGSIGPQLNNPAFLVLGEDNAFGVEATPDGEATNIRTYLRETIECGRDGTFMPRWGLNFGGTLSDRQIEQVIQLITNDPTGDTDFWDLVSKEGERVDEELYAGELRREFAITAALQEQLGRAPTQEEIDAYELPSDEAQLNQFLEKYGREPTAEEIRARSEEKTIVHDASSLSLTENTCGQFTNDTKAQVRSRPDPRVAATATPTPSGGGTATATATPSGPTPEQGQQLATTNGCVGCHSIDGSRIVGPTWLGLFGSTVTLSDGSTVVADEAYLRESIQNPGAKVVQDYPDGVMPSFASLSDEQIAALIAYIKSLAE